MTKQEQETALLHQQASTKYLQGEFEQALEVWRRLLELDPRDERAQEGVRLCEMLADDAAAPAGETAAAAAAAPAAAPAADGGASPDGGIDELEDLLGSGAAPAAPAVAAPPEAAIGDDAQESEIQFDFTDLPAEPELPDPNRQADGIDVGDVGNMAAIGLAAPGGAAAPPAEFDFAGIDAKLGGAPQPPPVAAAPAAAPVATAAAAPVATAAASELSLRIRALHAEALEAHQAGNAEEAMAVLSRLFILDENDPAARELEQIVRSQITVPEPAAAPVIDASAIDPILDEGGEEIGLNLDAVARSESGNELFEEDVAGAPPPRARPARTVPTAASAKRALPALTKVLIVATVVIGLAAAGFYLVPRFMGGGPAQPAEPSPAKTATKAPPASDGGAPADGTATDSVEAVAATPPPLPIDELLGQGQQAMDEARYADAVLAYKQILDADPEHQQARELLLLSGDRYREQQERLKKWEHAIASFNDARYQDALKAFYRLPEDVEAERLERYKRNGWYNMGLQSLRAGDCSEARKNFKEARAIDAEDAGVREALEMCNTCLLPQKGQGYFDTVSSLADRGLED